MSQNTTDARLIFAGPLAHGAALVVLALFPCAMLPLVYLCTRPLSDPSAAKSLVFGLNMLLFFATFMLYFALAIIPGGPSAGTMRHS